MCVLENFEIEWWTKIINKKDDQILQLTDGKGMESDEEEGMFSIDDIREVRVDPGLLEQIADLQEQVSDPDASDTSDTL